LFGSFLHSKQSVVLIDTTMLQNILGHPAPVVANVQTEFVGSENDLGFNAGCAKSFPATIQYENGHAAAAGDFVILHGRYSGHGLGKNWIASDIVRLQNGLLVEHWDVIQNEATEAESKSGWPMFGLTFPPVASPSVLTTNV